MTKYSGTSIANSLWKYGISQDKIQPHRFKWCKCFWKMLIKLVVRGWGEIGIVGDAVVLLVVVSEVIIVKRALQVFATFKNV